LGQFVSKPCGFNIVSVLIFGKRFSNCGNDMPSVNFE
jgi:hypothetical protein